MEGLTLTGLHSSSHVVMGMGMACKYPAYSSESSDSWQATVLAHGLLSDAYHLLRMGSAGVGWFENSGKAP